MNYVYDYFTTSDPLPDLQVGCMAAYCGDPDNKWKIENIRGQWAFATRDGAGQWFAKGVFVPVATKVKQIAKKLMAPAEPKKPKKVHCIADPVARLLAEAESLEQLWDVAGLAGLDVPEVQAKIAHLNPGLQRMGIGNRIRALYKAGKFDPNKIVWTPDGFIYDPMADVIVDE